MEHVDRVLQLLMDNTLFRKQSFFTFGTFEVKYLGDIIIQHEVWVDPKKLSLSKIGQNPKLLKAYMAS